MMLKGLKSSKFCVKSAYFMILLAYDELFIFVAVFKNFFDRMHIWCFAKVTHFFNLCRVFEAVPVEAIPE